MVNTGVMGVALILVKGIAVGILQNIAEMAVSIESKTLASSMRMACCRARSVESIQENVSGMIPGNVDVRLVLLPHGKKPLTHGTGGRDG